MEFENGADEELYRRMTQKEKADLIKKVKDWEEDQERYGVADSMSYPVRYLPLSSKPTEKEIQLYNAITQSTPQIRIAQKRQSKAASTNEAQAAFTNLMNAPMTMAAKSNVLGFLPQGYGAAALDLQGNKPKFGEKRGGKSKKRRRNKRKSRRK